MSFTVKAGAALIVVGLLAGAALLVHKSRSHPPVIVTLRIAVTPAEQSESVMGQASSARFKYLIGKQVGLKPALAQKLIIKPVPHTPLLEARVGVLTKDEGRKYAEAFVPTLQPLCDSHVQLALADQSIR